MSELIYNPTKMEWEAAATGETVTSKARSYAKKYRTFKPAKAKAKAKAEAPQESPSDLMKAINFKMATKGAINKSLIPKVDYDIQDYGDRRRSINNAGRYQGYMMRDGTLIVPDAMIDFIAYRGASRGNWKIDRRGYTIVTDDLLNDLMNHNEYEPRTKAEALVRERNLNCIFILADLA